MKASQFWNPFSALSATSVKSVFSPHILCSSKTHFRISEIMFQKLFSSMFQYLALFLQAKFLDRNTKNYREKHPCFSIFISCVKTLPIKVMIKLSLCFSFSFYYRTLNRLVTKALFVF